MMNVNGQAGWIKTILVAMETMNLYQRAVRYKSIRYKKFQGVPFMKMYQTFRRNA